MRCVWQRGLGSDPPFVSEEFKDPASIEIPSLNIPCFAIQRSSLYIYHHPRPVISLHITIAIAMLVLASKPYLHRVVRYSLIRI